MSRIYTFFKTKISEKNRLASKIN